MRIVVVGKVIADHLVNKRVAACASTQKEAIRRILKKSIIAQGSEVVVHEQESQDNVTQASATAKDESDRRGEEERHHDSCVYACDRPNQYACKESRE